jgi:hypothetical protein
MKIFIVLILLTVTAQANPSAEDLYNQGQIAYEHGDYAMSIVAWQESLKLAPLAVDIYFNIAQAYRLQGDCVKALASYRQFLSSAHPANRWVTLANEFIQSLEKICEASKIVAPAKTIEPVAVTKRVDAPKLVETIKHVEHRRSESSQKLIGLTTGGVGLGLLITGLEFGHHASVLSAQATEVCITSCDWNVERSVVSSSRRDVVIGWAFDAVGVGAMVTGAVLYYVGSREHGFAVQPHAHGAELSWSKSW